MEHRFVYVEDHRRRWVDSAVVLLTLAVLAAAALLRSRDSGLDLTPNGGWDWLVTVLALAAVPAWFVVGDGAFDGWSPGRGLAVGDGELVVDEVTFGFAELAPATETLGPSAVGPDGRLEVPLADGASVGVRPRDPSAFTEALRRSYRAWSTDAGARRAP